MGKSINYYASGNTAQGFYSLLISNLSELKKIYVLKDGASTIKTNIIKRIANAWLENDCDIEYIHCAFDNELIDGIINNSSRIAVVDGNMLHINEPMPPGFIEEVNLGVGWDLSKIEPRVPEVIDINTKARESYKKAYEFFGEALKVHDEWEKIYVDNMDFKRADSFAEEVIEKVLKDSKLDKEADVKDRFMGAATPDGPKDFIEDLTKDISKRYFIKGRPGTGKSTLLKKLVKAASDRGIDVEIYHCGFDPNSLDMIILRELDVCIFDSTAPHEYFPSKPTDEILDMYKELITPGTDEKYENELKDIISRYRDNISQANNLLKETKDLSNNLEEIYVSAIDIDKVNEVVDKLMINISNYK